MAQKTSINIKPCNLGSSSPHNKRSAEYLANIRKEKFYIRTDLMARNEMWVSSQLGDTSLTDYYNLIAAMVKEKTGRAMQTKDRERVNKKTGKVTIVRGSTPLKEGVVVIKEDTTMEQLQKFCKVCNERWGVTALQVFIHRDEGHYGVPGDNATWKPNLHAHIVWDWMNHDTGKSCKLDEKAMSEMQTVLAECLEMERGTSKEITGKEHLERTDFILAKQKQEAERAKAEKEAALAAKEEAEKERLSIECENKAKEQYRQSLDTEIADKERQLKDERKAKMDSILDSVSSLVGVGKSAAIEKENAKLKAENERIRKAFPDAVKNKVAELTQALAAEKQKAEAERDRALVQSRSLGMERDKAVRQLQEQQANEQQHIRQAVSQATAEKDKTIRCLPIFFIKQTRSLSEPLMRLSISARSSTNRSLPRPKLPTSRASCRSTEKQPNSRMRSAHGSVTMQKATSLLTKLNIAIHSKRLAMSQRGRMIGKSTQYRKMELSYDN